MRRWQLILMMVALVGLLTGCSDAVDADQLWRDPALNRLLSVGQSAGQTFVGRHAGLNGVDLWLEPATAGNGEVELHLRSDVTATDDLATAILPLSQIQAPGFYHFPLTAQADSLSRYYYVFVTLKGEGSVSLGGGPATAYLDGSGYFNHQPEEFQSAFRLSYDRGALVLDWMKTLAAGGGLLVVAVLLFVVPGWALLAWFWRGPHLIWPVRAGLAVGISLAIYPVLVLWTGLVGLHLGPVYVWGPVVGGVVALIWRYRSWRPRTVWARVDSWRRSEAFRPDCLLLVVLALVFGVRLVGVRTLDGAMWGDGFQHTMIAQLVVDNGGLFSSWAPYSVLQDFTYHFGFHTCVAAFHWVTGLSVVQSTLWVGQLLNGLAILALYPLAVRIGRNRWAGVLAVVLAGLVSPMPMYYVNWGRYTQLAGQVILPAAAFITWMMLESPQRRDWGMVGLTWLTIGGMALTHYRILIFYVIFVIAWMLLALRKENFRRAVVLLTVMAVGGGLIFLPWFIHTSAGAIVSNFSHQLKTQPAQMTAFARDYNAIGALAGYMPIPWWFVLAGAVGWGLWQRRREFLLIFLWWWLLFMATNPDWFSLPGAGSITNFAFFIAAYMPFGVLVGEAGGFFLERLSLRRWGIVPAAVVILGLGVWGGYGLLRQNINPGASALLTRPDVRAMEWIRANTEPEEQILINSFFAYGDSVIVGSDGGWWISLLTKRGITVPPLNYGTEKGPTPDYREWVNALTIQIQTAGLDDPATQTMLRERGVRYLYIGQRQGRVNYAGPYVFDPVALGQSQAWRVVYHQDRVWIFERVESRQ